MSRRGGLVASVAWRKASVPDKPYEDAMFCDEGNGVFCVADGVTRSRDAEGVYPRDSPALTAALIIVEEAKRLAENGAVSDATCSATAKLFAAFERANGRIAELAKKALPRPDFLVDDLPGAVATICFIHGGELAFCHIGDTCLLRLDGAGCLTRLTTDQTAAVERWARSHQHLTLAERQKTVRTAFRNVPGRTESFGVLTGEAAALGFLECGTVSLMPDDCLLLLSDGVLPMFESSISGETVKMVSQGHLEQLLLKAERLDISLRQSSDDKTLLLIQQT